MNPGALLTAFLLAAEPAQSGTQAAPDAVVRTYFSVLVGFPAGDSSYRGEGALVPGAVIRLTEGAEEPADDMKRQIVEKSVLFTKAADKLWSTFRLDPARRLHQGHFEPSVVGNATELPVLKGTGIKISVTLLQQDKTTTVYRVVFRRSEETLADSTVRVARGGRTVVGGMDGEAAPYVFLFIEPERPPVPPSASSPAQKERGISSPLIVDKVEPRYPPEARRDKVQGVVVLEAEIDENGIVGEIKVLQTPDDRLSAAAAEAIRQWKFLPARTSAGKPIRVRTSITVNFALR